MSAYRAGVIGLGRMGSTFDDEIMRGGDIFLPYGHGPAYHYSPLTDLVAGADIHDEQRALFGERWGLSTDHLYSDYREMLAKEELDIVSVCTTARIRSAVVQDAARAGVKAIWAEKPISLSLEEADAMVQTCREEGVVLAINCQRRWHPLFSEARRIIEAGELGDIQQVTAYASCNLSHNGSHLIDTMTYLAGGKVEWVFGEMESDEAAAGDDDLMGNGYMAFDNGARAYVRAMPTGSAYWDFDVIGERGRIRSLNDGMEWELIRMEASDPDSFGFRPDTVRGNSPLPAKYPFPWPERFRGTGLLVLEDLVASIETGRPPRCSGDDGLAVLEAAMALRESHRRGGVKVALPLEDRTLTIRSTEIQGDDVPARIRRLRGG